MLYKPNANNPIFKIGNSISCKTLEVNLIVSKELLKNQQCVFNASFRSFFIHGVSRHTVAINELLCMKNAGAQIAMDFS